jgi:hypothetical protein
VGSREQEQQAYMLLPGHDGLDLEKKRTLVCWSEPWWEYWKLRICRALILFLNEFVVTWIWLALSKSWHSEQALCSWQNVRQKTYMVRFFLGVNWGSELAMSIRTCKICRIFIFFLVFLSTDFWPDYKKSNWTMAHSFSVLHHCASSKDTLIGWDAVYSCQVFCKR